MFNEQNHLFTRSFYDKFRNVNALRSELTWTHFRILLRVGKADMAAFSQQAVLDELQSLKDEISLRYKVIGVELFGSFVRNEQHAESDIDVLVEFAEGADLFDLVGLSQFLEDRLQRKVDVVPRNALRDELKDAVFAEAVAV